MMFAVVARFRNGRFELLGFRSTQEEIESGIDSYIRKHGADYLGDAGVQFDVELAA